MKRPGKKATNLSTKPDLERLVSILSMNSLSEDQIRNLMAAEASRVRVNTVNKVIVLLYKHGTVEHLEDVASRISDLKDLP